MSTAAPETSVLQRPAENYTADIEQAVGKSRIAKSIAEFCEGSRFREFAPAKTSWGVAAVEEAVYAFLRSGRADIAESTISGRIDTSDQLHDLAREITRSVLYNRLVDDLLSRMTLRYPDVSKERLENRVSGAVFDAFMKEVKKSDPSKPLDSMRGNAIPLVYIPFHNNGKGPTQTMTSWWGRSCDVVSIKPDQAFIGFMKLANVSKEDWMSALVACGHDLLNDGDLSDAEMRERAAAWARANWSVSGPSLVDVKKLVEAVDVCAWGFTPFIAFNIDAFKLVHRNWNQALVVKGGILGLHDFKLGSGNPIRFEGSCIVPARPGNFLLHDRLEHNLAKVHGFTSASFASKVGDSTDKRYSVQAMERQVAQDMNLPQLDVKTIAGAACRFFEADVQEMTEIVDATGLESGALDAVLSEALQARYRTLVRASPVIERELADKTAEQRVVIGSLVREEKIAALVGLKGVSSAAELVRNLAGVFDGPRL